MKFIFLPLFALPILVRLASAQNDPIKPQVQIQFVPNRVKMLMGNMTDFNYSIIVDESTVSSSQSARDLILEFTALTLSPQFQIIEFSNGSSATLHLPIKQLRDQNFVYNSTLNLKATYIGHATLQLKSYLLTDDNSNRSLSVTSDRKLIDITVIRNEGTLDKIFMYSVIVFITISYINLGAQIDFENVRRLSETPKIIFIGLLIGFAVMPIASWIVGHVFFRDQPMYRMGSFIYACSPAASASVLWTVLFDADKELALGLQIASTVGALITMPALLYTMDKSIDLEGQYTIKVPYTNLARTLIVLIAALIFGSWVVRTSKRAKQISQRVFRPLTIFVLTFIVVFSSVVYWYIYKMFDLHITAMALIVTITTYIISGLLGYLIHRDIDQMITISISSTYRNSGIAFAALVVAFQPPDTFIAYVPCLTQVVSTSLIGSVLYLIKSLKSCYGKESK